MPEAITIGVNKTEALLNAKDALETGLSFYLDDHKALLLAIKPR